MLNPPTSDQRRRQSTTALFIWYWIAIGILIISGMVRIVLWKQGFGMQGLFMCVCGVSASPPVYRAVRKRHPEGEVRKHVRNTVLGLWSLLFLIGVLFPIEFPKRPVLPIARVEAAKPVAVTSKPTSIEVQQSPAQNYSERLRTYWLPAAIKLPDLLPAASADFGETLTQFEELAIDVGDGAGLELGKEGSARLQRLISVVSGKQKRLLPAMRGRYAAELDAKLFRSDIRVEATGTAETGLRITGAAFAANANVADMQARLAPTLRRLRFHKIAYRWSPVIQHELVYAMPAPSDVEVGYWGSTDSFTVTGRSTSLDASMSAHDPSCVPQLAASVGLKC